MKRQQVPRTASIIAVLMVCAGLSLFPQERLGAAHDCEIGVRIFDGTVFVDCGYVVDAYKSNTLVKFQFETDPLGQPVNVPKGSITYGKYENSMIDSSGEATLQDLGQTRVHIVPVTRTTYDGSEKVSFLIHDEKQYFWIAGKDADLWPDILATYRSR